ELPKNAGQRTFARFDTYLQNHQQDNLATIREEIRAIMTENVGVFRTEAGLSEAIARLETFQTRVETATLSNKSLKMNPELTQRWELDNMLAVALIMARGALERRESRGGHARIDYPDRKDEYNQHTLAWMAENGTVRFGHRPVDMSIFKENGTHREEFNIIERKY
ncbi:hypothetical protein KKI24_02660, partial [bacterium]|nr:hypothetical protein [bacterium]